MLQVFDMYLYRLKNHLKTAFRKPYRLARRSPEALRLQAARAAHAVVGDRNGLSREALYPPRERSKSTPDWVQNHGAEYGAEIVLLDASASVAHPMPKTPHESIRRQFQMDPFYDRPGTFVATIPAARVWGEGMVIAPDNRLLGDVSIDFGLDIIGREWRLEKLVRLDARVAVLSTAGGSIFYHWLYQLLPRIELIRRAGIALDGVDYFLVNDLAGRYKLETLQAIGIGRDKLLLSSELRYVQVRELIAPSVVLRAGCYPEWMRSFLRRTFLSETDAVRNAAKRLYLSRGEAKYRRVLNEDAVCDVLRQYGFEIVRLEALPFSGQARLLSEAAVVVAPHGAGLSNVVFCAPGTKVIEIFAPELVTGFYWRLCTESQLDYYYILGEGKPETLRADYEQSWNERQDITVDLALLRAVLDQAEVSRTG